MADRRLPRPAGFESGRYGLEDLAVSLQSRPRAGQRHPSPRARHGQCEAMAHTRTSDARSRSWFMTRAPTVDVGRRSFGTLRFPLIGHSPAMARERRGHCRSWGLPSWSQARPGVSGGLGSRPRGRWSLPSWSQCRCSSWRGCAFGDTDRADVVADASGVRESEGPVAWWAPADEAESSGVGAGREKRRAARCLARKGWKRGETSAAGAPQHTGADGTLAGRSWTAHSAVVRVC